MDGEGELILGGIHCQFEYTCKQQTIKTEPTKGCEFGGVFAMTYGPHELIYSFRGESVQTTELVNGRMGRRRKC